MFFSIFMCVMYSFLKISFVLEMESRVFQTGLKFAISDTSRLHDPSAKISGMHQHTWFCVMLEIKAKALSVLGKHFTS